MTNKRLFRVLGAGCLALFMGVGTLCGVLIAPMGANASVGGGGAELTAQEKLLAGTGLGLDPQNDPVVFTTDYGLDIKYANALNLAGYTYFTMGKYNNYDINWVIIGYDPSMSEIVGEYSGDAYQRNPIQGDNTVSSTIDDSPAGIAILKENFAISSSAKSNDEIGDGCVLCLSEYSLYNTPYHTSDTFVTYGNSALFDEMEELYNTLFDNSIKPHIALTKLFSNSYQGLDESEAHLFTFAAHPESYGENFAIYNYLSGLQIPAALITSQSSTTSRYWLRSHTLTSGYTHYAHVAELYNGNGAYGGNMSQTTNNAIRPAFVLELG